MDDCIFCKDIVAYTSDNLKNSANLKQDENFNLNLTRHSEHSEESSLGNKVWILRPNKSLGSE